MIPYWSAFVFLTICALQFSRSRSVHRLHVVYVVALVLLTLFVGLRYRVGGDWVPYIEIYQRIALLDFDDAIGQIDVGYALINWIAAWLGFDLWFVNVICAICVVFGVGKLCQQQPNPFLALLVALPYFIIVVGMGYTRQAAAIGIVCYALTLQQPFKLTKIIAVIGLATLLHKTAILALPIILVPVFRRSVIAAVFGAIAFAGIFAFALSGAVDQLVNQYVEGSYDSQGALVRVLMNVVCASLFLMMRSRFDFDDFGRNYWTVSSILSFAALGAILVAPSTSGIDRVALFLIPLQIVVLARLPYLKPGPPVRRELLIAVIAYCAVIQAVWLIAAEHAEFWLPYRTMFDVWAFGRG